MKDLTPALMKDLTPALWLCDPGFVFVGFVWLCDPGFVFVGFVCLTPALCLPSPFTLTAFL
jgi:hypothetical protein